MLVGLVGSSSVALGGSLHARLALTPDARSLAVIDHTRHVQGVGFALAFAGLTVLTAAWLMLGRLVRERDDGVRTVLHAVAVWVLPLMVAPPLFSNDAWSYVAEGDLVAQDRSPYMFTPLDLSGPIVHAVGRTWVNVPAPYGPLPLMWGGVVASLSRNPWWGLLGFRILALAALAVLAYAVSRLARFTGRDPATATWLAVASPFTLAHGIGGAHVDLSMAALLALAVLCSLRGRWLLGAVLVGAAAAFKAPAIVGDVAVVLAWAVGSGKTSVRTRDRLRRSVDVLAVSSGTLVGLGLISGLGAGWVTGLMTPLRHRSPLSPTTELAVHLGQLLGAQLLTPLQVSSVIILALVVGWVALRAPARSAPAAVRAAALVMSCTVLLSPVVHYWYYFWCLPLLASAVLSHRLQRVVLTLTIVLGLLAPADFSAGHLPFSGELVMLGCAALLTSLVLPSSDASGSPRAPANVEQEQ